MNVLLKVNNSDLVNGTFEVPEGVTSISRFAFYNCHYLESVIIPASVTRIYDNAFYGCVYLKNVIFAKNSKLKSIDLDAFDSCRSLKSPVNNYKAFLIRNGKLIARQNNKEYKLGHKSYARRELECCKNGLHYCTNIFDIFNYYWGKYGKDFVIAICDVSDENVGHNADSKRCARWIKPTKILSREEVIRIMNGEEII